MAPVIDIHAHLVVEESRNMMKAAAEKGDVGAEALSQGGIGISQAQAQRQCNTKPRQGGTEGRSLLPFLVISQKYFQPSGMHF